MPDIELIPRNDMDGRTYYEPIVAQAKGTSQYKDTAFTFTDLPGFWEIGYNPPPQTGQWYTLELATKPKTSPKAKPGSLYQDIVKITLATDARNDLDGYMDKVAAEDSDQMPQNGPVSPNAGPPPNPAAVGSCANHAEEYINAGIMPLPEGRDIFSWHRECRDRLFWEVNQVPVMPDGWCYIHKVQRTYSARKADWFHQIEGEQLWCSRAGILDAEGNVVE